MVTVFFAILDVRTVEIGVANVTSHLEDIANQAIEADAAYICDIIVSALADGSAEIAAKWLRPDKAECEQVEAIHCTAFLICIRLAFTQARIWALSNDAPIYETPPDFSEIDLTIGSNFQKASDEYGKTTLTCSSNQRQVQRAQLCEMPKV